MKNTVLTFGQAKKEHKKQTMLTAYDYSTAKLIDEAGVNSILVGDSLGMVCLGYEDTLSVTMEDMIHHTRAVTRGAKNALVVADMPFMSYQTSTYDAVVNAGRLIKEGHAQAVKLEGGATVCEQIRAIVNASIPVCAHIGMTPQSVNAFGGFKVQGKGEEAAQKILDDEALYMQYRATLSPLEQKQAEDIRYIFERKGESYLPDELLQVAKIRLTALELSLSDIGKMLEPPISRSGVNHRLKKISLIADTLRGKEKTGD